MKKILVILISIICFGGICGIIFNSNFYYSKKLVQAIRAEDLNEIESILEKKPDCVNTYPSILPREVLYGVFDAGRVNYPLIEACGTDNLEIVKLLVAFGADVNCNDGRTPLSITYCGKQENWYQISVFLIESGASLNYKTEYSGEYLSVLEDIIHPKSGESLPGYIPENSEEVYMAFCYAVGNCNLDKVSWGHVLQDGVSYNRQKIVKFLLENSYCDVNTVLGEMNILMFAARDANAEMVQLLLEYGADKDYTTSEGWTAYDFAVQSKNEEIVTLLSN
ncbi:MAG: hypothetical protein E7292_11370 [Lachnospiraceae bacterium]|nr:hypothetical protein [Lachnospiraceae bacterium]